MVTSEPPTRLATVSHPRGHVSYPADLATPREGQKTFGTAQPSSNQTLNERVVVTEHGKRKSITKQQAIFKQLVNKAASGDHRAAQLVINEMRAIEAVLSSTDTGREIIDEADQQVFDNFLKRLGKREEEDGNDNGSNCG
jgi:hypothetical protein